MAKALFFGLPLHGHTNPSLGLVSALVGGGEEVVYFSGEGFAGKIEGAGAQFRGYRAGVVADLQRLAERTDEISWRLLRTTEQLLANDLAAFGAERPDYVIADSLAPWGQWVAQWLGVPLVTSVTTFAFNRHVLAYGAAHGARPKSVRRTLRKVGRLAKAALLARQLRRTYGVSGSSVMGPMFIGSDLNIVYTSRQVQPCQASFDDRFQFIGPSIGERGAVGERGAAGDFADLALTESTDDIVYVSLGTLFNAAPTFYRNCFKAFGGDRLRVIMAIGGAVEPASLGAAPANFLVRSYLPQLEVLQRASVFVSHGGMNSVHESLYYGVPLVMVPQMGEQEIVARRIEELGAGVCLGSREPLTADRLKAALERVRHDDRFRQQATKIQQSLHSAGGPQRAADAIMAFTRARIATRADTRLAAMPFT